MNLYKVTIERTTYHGTKTVETRELFAESPKKINTYRLGGFQRDSIKVLSATKIRAAHTIELDVDNERNEVLFSVNALEHIKTTLEEATDLNALINDYDGSEDEALESLGYVEATADNTYNYCSDFDNEINFHVYLPKGENGSEWYYNDKAVVLVYIHEGLDVRGGYRYLGAYRGASSDGMGYFLENHVRLTVTKLGTEDRDEKDYDGSNPWYQITKDGYKIKSYDSKTQKVILTKDGEDFQLSWYHPAMGF